MIGVDIISLDRIKKLLKTKSGKAFINKTFTKKEQEYINSKKDKLSHYATTFAAKEAVFKALGTGLGDAQEVEILREKSGRPVVKLSGNARKSAKSKKLFVNMSYEKKNAVAVAILQ